MNVESSECLSHFDEVVISFEVSLASASLFQVVNRSTGSCHETMSRKFWDVHAFVGRTASVKLVDNSSDGWAHINFDDLGGDISCGQK